MSAYPGISRGVFSFFLVLGILGICFSLAGCPSDKPNFGGFFVITEDCPSVDEFGVPVCIPHPFVNVNGAWVKDLSGAGGNILNFPTGGTGFDTTDATGHLYIQYGRMPAVWNSGVMWPQPCGTSGQTVGAGSFNVTFENPYIGWGCGVGVPPPPPQPQANPSFSLTGSTPGTITISGSNLSTQYGMPQLYLYVFNGNPNQPILASHVTATGVSNGTATFNFPTATSGGPLPQGVYAYGLWNVTSSGGLQFAGTNSISLGWNNTSMTAPFGVDAIDETNTTVVCTSDDYGNITCTQEPNTNWTDPIVTLASSGQVKTPNGIITVGSEPTSIKAYGGSGGIYSFSWGPDPYGGYQETYGPPNAIVTNFASNTVSILDLANVAVTHTISVGTQPINVALNSNQTKAYVANFGSSSISVVDLNSGTQTNVIAVGSQPEALALDPSGTSLWIGGLNYISRIDVGTFATLQTNSVSGQVTSLAVSAGQNALVYTTMSSSGGSTTFQAQQAAISSGAVQQSYAQYNVSSSPHPEYAYAISTVGPAPGSPGWLMSSGAVVSTNYGNSVAVIGTPTGFEVIDLVNKNVVMQGNTPSTVRGIATDPSQGIAYLTAPDSNSFINVPLPSVQ